VHHDARCRLYHGSKQSNSGYVKASAGGSDDLQTQLLLRDQLGHAAAAAAAAAHQQQQQHLHVHYAGVQQQHPHQHQQDRAASSLSMASAMAGGASALSLHGMLPAPSKPASLPKAVAAMLGNAKDWTDKVDKMNGLAEALSRQVCGAEGAHPCGPSMLADGVLGQTLTRASYDHTRMRTLALPRCCPACLFMALPP
jgi:hypothetical protein